MSVQLSRLLGKEHYHQGIGILRQNNKKLKTERKERMKEIIDKIKCWFRSNPKFSKLLSEVCELLNPKKKKAGNEK